MRRLASSLYNPPTYPHPQTGYPWVCHPLKNKIDQICDEPGVYIFFSTIPQPYPPRLVSRPIRKPVYWIGKSINSIRDRVKVHSVTDFKKLVPNIVVCYMRFPCDNDIKKSDQRVTHVEALLLTMFATIKNKDFGTKESDTIVFDKDGFPFDILRTFMGVDINNPAGVPVALVQHDRTFKFGFDNMLDTTRQTLEFPPVNDTESIFPLGILYDGDKLLDGDFSNFGKEQPTDGVCKPCDKKKEEKEKESNPIKFKDAPLSYSSGIEIKFDKLEYQYAKDNGLIEKSHIVTVKPLKQTNVGIFTRFGRWVKGFFVPVKKKYVAASAAEIECQIDSNIKIIDSIFSNILSSLGLHHRSEVRIVGSNLFWEKL
ncbi:hypothetical protein ACTFIR_000880 [Dictyostelium discoideum]